MSTVIDNNYLDIDALEIAIKFGEAQRGRAEVVIFLSNAFNEKDAAKNHLANYEAVASAKSLTIILLDDSSVALE